MDAQDGRVRAAPLILSTDVARLEPVAGLVESVYIPDGESGRGVLLTSCAVDSLHRRLKEMGWL